MRELAEIHRSLGEIKGKLDSLIDRHDARDAKDAAIVSACSDDAKHEYVQHYRNVSGFLAYFETVCVISHAEALEMCKAWVRTEAELRLYRLPPEQRRAVLLDPQGGPQRFLPLRRRLQMLREIDRQRCYGGLQ
jgi:hypothetical protein